MLKSLFRTPSLFLRFRQRALSKSLNTRVKNQPIRQKSPLFTWTAQAALHAFSSSKKTSMQCALTAGGLDTISKNKPCKGLRSFDNIKKGLRLRTSCGFANIFMSFYDFLSSASERIKTSFFSAKNIPKNREVTHNPCACFAFSLKAGSGIWSLIWIRNRCDRMETTLQWS